MSGLVAHNGARIFGGCERWTVRTLAALQQRGRSVKLLCNHEIVAQQARAHGIPVQLAPLRGDLVFTDALRFASVLRGEQPEAVLFTTFKKIWLGGIGARLAHVPRTILRIGLSSDVPRNLKYRVAMRWIDEVIVNAPEMAQNYPGATVIPNGVTVPQVTVSRERFREQHGIPADAMVIGSVSRMSRQKRLDRLIEALTLLPENVIALLAGGGGRTAELQQLAVQQGVIDRTLFLGERDDVGNVLNALDVFVTSSDLEGLSHSLLEAMAMGLPIVATPVSGAASTIGGDAGVVVAEFSAGAIAAGVKKLLASVELRARLGAAARARYHEKFAFDQMIDAYDQALFTA